MGIANQFPLALALTLAAPPATPRFFRCLLAALPGPHFGQNSTSTSCSQSLLILATPVASWWLIGDLTNEEARQLAAGGVELGDPAGAP